MNNRSRSWWSRIFFFFFFFFFFLRKGGLESCYVDIRYVNCQDEINPPFLVKQVGPMLSINGGGLTILL